MAVEEFKELASARKLDTATADLLLAQKYDSEEALSLMKPEQLNELQIPDSQKKAVRLWLVDLYVKFNREESTKALQEAVKPVLSMKIADKAGPSKAASEPDYAEPSTPRPSIYEKCTNIAVVGEDIAEKASLITRLRGVAVKDAAGDSATPDPSKNGIIPYKHDTSENMILWDLPPVTKTDDGYLKQVEFDQYDAVVISSAEKPSEWHDWLIKVAGRGKMRLFFVHTNIDGDVESDKKDSGKDHVEETFLGKKRAGIEEKVGNAVVYLVSVKPEHGEQWDMPKLVKDIAEVVKREQKPKLFHQDALDEIKLDVDADKISRASDKDADKKDGKPLNKKEKFEQLAETFKKEIGTVVAKAAKKADIGVLKKEIDKYKKGFGVSELANVNVDPLEEAVDPLKMAKKGFKATVMSCLGKRSEGAKSKESGNKIFDVIAETAPALLSGAIDACKKAAIDKLGLSK